MKKLIEVTAWKHPDGSITFAKNHNVKKGHIETKSENGYYLSEKSFKKIEKLLKKDNSN